ncbi:molybdopterin-binding protein [Actibacterium pelagium]|uniref:Molybdopterin biosynthesis protein n=1 Tax=Actibacterium pelagium TaxID=2029103 RepID=A0A917ADZ4_9RHOB|nr:molybdopterin-binding protein [Actibacterium pelagium]GGE46015.1 molybdopterin biosynthesis protein [Actibacterium pelagium]
MQFGPVDTQDAAGAILAHSLKLKGGALKKGTILDAEDIARIAGAGIDQVTVARLERDDVAENTAADRLARAIVPYPERAGLIRSHAFTGRVNLNAACHGVVELDAEAIHDLNSIHPEITLATLPPMMRVTEGLLVGTVKIIGYAVPGGALDDACAAARAALRVKPVIRKSAGLLLTEVPGQKATISTKAEKVIAARLAALGVTLAEVKVVPHKSGPMADALKSLKGDMQLILTGSATSDLHDTGPNSVRKAGGKVQRFGMPVDPGNLLFLGDLMGKPVIGLPGCARSPALNGADWVLERVACGLEISSDDFARMGVGGLLKEIPTRPHPRERKTKA